MALFVVMHQHTADTCPAKDPKIGPMLLQILSRDNARRFDIAIQAEAVVDGEHTLHLILTAPNRQKVREFLAAFAQSGSLEVLPASDCDTVIARAGC